jgi:UDP-4-amino-4,6-dideoxy-N-acetyl-beta-L-altrosamine transaminase
LEKKFLPYSHQVIDEEDIESVVRTLRSGWLTTGPTVKEFEEKFAEEVNADYAIACSSGTGALHLLYVANGIGPGDSVIIPSMTFLATANAVRYSGAEVIFSDVDPDTGLMNASHFRDAWMRASDKNIKAVCAVHLNGQCVDMKSMCQEVGDVLLFEDACHSLGAFIFDGSGKKVKVGACSFSNATIFSTHPVKAITTGEGGIITTNDEGLARKLRQLRSHGVTRKQDLTEIDLTDLNNNRFMDPWYYEMRDLGFNYRLSDIHSALGISQLKKLKYFIQQRNLLRDRYEQHLCCFGTYVRPLTLVNNCIPAWHLSVALIDFEEIGISRSEVITQLSNRGIGAQVHYIPVHQQPYYKNRYGPLILPGVSTYYSRCLSLPLWPGMNLNDVDRVIEALVEILGISSDRDTSIASRNK